ncbi:hypothetical protein GCM10010912_03080 [Paenibacillus albidus]|uniref:Uncharacterized protein n=1 Tax=Paenibacillus albidus TaxID=2041023 RepID=A0A917F907_9BACL|nr:hypothetical protein GCM10010912_03080 [Paenibacillus albidus]
MYDIRMAIGTMLVYNGVPFMTDSDYNKLVTIEEQYEKAASGGDLLLCLKHNGIFHSLSIIWHGMVKRFTLLTNTGG